MNRSPAISKEVLDSLARSASSLLAGCSALFESRDLPMKFLTRQFNSKTRIAEQLWYSESGSHCSRSGPLFV